MMNTYAFIIVVVVGFATLVRKSSLKRKIETSLEVSDAECA